MIGIGTKLKAWIGRNYMNGQRHQTRKWMLKKGEIKIINDLF